jgi:hypothetical protein
MALQTVLQTEQVDTLLLCPVCWQVNSLKIEGITCYPEIFMVFFSLTGK